MFGKFGKKKSDKEEPKVNSKQKNDLFTLLEESSEKTPVKNNSINNSREETEKPKSSYTSAKKSLDTDSKKELSSKNNPSKPQPESTSDSKPQPESTSDSKPQPESTSDSKPQPKLMRDSKQETKPAETKVTAQTFQESSIKGDKSQHLLLEIEKLPDKTIKPVVDFNENFLFYPLLSKIGEEPNDTSFLDELVTEGVLNKEVYEKLIICPSHPNAYSSSVRLYCPKCNSLNVDKLNLYEHKRCGFITESTDFDFSKPENSTCPSCNKKIMDFKKEIRIPAMWHQCLDCKEKFDNAIIKLYCRQHEHDFETNSGQFVTTYAYKLKDYEAPITSDDDKMKEDLVQLLSEFNFSTEFKASVKGKSGNSHKIPIYAKNNSNGDIIVIFIHRNSENLSQSDINGILVPILDVGPKHTLLLTTSKVDESVKTIAKQYGIDVISDPDLSKILHFVDVFVSDDYSRNGEK